MADGIVGQAFTDRFRTGITGQTFTIDPVATTAPDGTGFTPTLVTVPDDPNGDLYELAFTPDQAGVWRVEAIDQNGRRFGDTYQFVAAPTVTLDRRVNGPDAVIQGSWFNDHAQAIEKVAAVLGIDVTPE